MPFLRHLGAAAAATLALCGATQAQAPMQATDKYLWLEDVTGDKPLAWVAERNAVSRKEIEGRPQFAAMRERIKAVYNSKERIAYVSKHGQWLYNFWRDEAHVRGIWRRSSVAAYASGKPDWETVLDVDQLARDEKENWVWSGAACLSPKGERCLISFSRGGGDAVVVREFDTASRSFLKDGFTLPESKSSVNWIDLDHIFVGTDFGPGAMTSSGYPRIAKQWQRGTPLAAATTVYEAGAADLGVWASQDEAPGFQHQMVKRQIDFYTNEAFLRRDGKLIKLDKPNDAEPTTVRDQLLLQLRSAWTVGGATYPQGALLAIPLERFLQGERNFATLFAPTPTSSLEHFTVTKSAILLNTLDNVRGKVVELRLQDGKWQRRKVDAPDFGSIGITALDDVDSDQYFMTVTDFLTPTTLYLGEVGSDKRSAIKSLPAFFDASRYKVAQHHATSKDGTRVPYFLIMGKKTKLNGKNPTALYGYGGFEVAMKPNYLGTAGDAWLAHGGVYVLSNIRGGGEFGPRWHQAALRENRQRAYEDFIAIAEDLIKTKVTSPRHLGILGGSNGGLLMGAMLTQRPDLFNAIVCQVPLLDMRRYSQLLAGASWMGEYGNPDVPADWAFISKYSPYHNVFKDKHYPRVLFTTSTRDDRVHPGHARKMVALMQEQGHDVLYYENMEGGHAGAANNDQQAQMWAMTYTFLLNQLK